MPELCDLGRCKSQWESDDKDTASPVRILHNGNTAPQIHQNIKRDGKSQSRSLRFRSKKRLKDLIRFLAERGLEKRANIVPLDDPYGPTIGSDQIDGDEIEGIMVSEETEPAAEEINRLRVKEGKKPLLIFVLKMILAEDGKPISSTRIRRQEVDRFGRLIG